MHKDFELMNEYGKNRVPFFFIISYDKSELFVYKLEEIKKNNIHYSINHPQSQNSKDFFFSFNPIAYADYLQKFNLTLKRLFNGDSYLLNLTFQTEINTNLSLKEIYEFSHSPFKLFFQNKFVCFSPEIFINIEGNKISTNPMKGTIKSNFPNAEQILLNTKKEIDEHYTIVDLLRNDLSLVAKQVRVERFRYLEKITTNKGEIFQTSSLISGFLPSNWNAYVGDILDKITPAGSVTGAPKKRTCEIIEEIEEYKRGFYTGVAGIFDGYQLKSYVLIRFVENINGKLFYKSGGGITTQSNPKDEYNELLSKIYVPIIRNS